MSNSILDRPILRPVRGSQNEAEGHRSAVGGKSGGDKAKKTSQHKHSHHQKHHHHSHPKKNFPLNNYFKQLKPKKESSKFLKSTLMMVSNLLPALSVSETLDSLGEALDMQSLAKHLKPASAIWTRQFLIDGVDKKNYYKPVAATISAHALIGANQKYGMPRFLLRPALGMFLFGIEETESILHLTGLKEMKDVHHHHHEHDGKKCDGKHGHDEHKCDGKHGHEEHECDGKHGQCDIHHEDVHQEKHDHDHEPKWAKLFTGLGILETQLNTIAPLVNKASSRLFASEGIQDRVGKVLFNTGFLSLGFVGLGEGIKRGAELLGKSKPKFVENLVANIESTICACCGTTGGCATAIAEDVTATANLY